MEFCGENQLTMVIEGGSDQLFGELITFEDPILMPIISQPPMFTLPPPSVVMFRLWDGMSFFDIIMNCEFCLNRIRLYYFISTAGALVVITV